MNINTSEFKSIAIMSCSTFFRGTVLDVETSAKGVIESTKLLAHLPVENV